MKCHMLGWVTSAFKNSQATIHQTSIPFQSERLITLCATDPTFTTLPASMVASASLASAVQQDYESGQPPTSGPSVRIKEIFNKIREFTRVEMVRKDVLLLQFRSVVKFSHTNLS